MAARRILLAAVEHHIGPEAAERRIVLGVVLHIVLEVEELHTGQAAVLHIDPVEVARQIVLAAVLHIALAVGTVLVEAALHTDPGEETALGEEHRIVPEGVHRTDLVGALRIGLGEVAVPSPAEVGDIADSALVVVDSTVAGRNLGEGVLGSISRCWVSAAKRVDSRSSGCKERRGDLRPW